MTPFQTASNGDCRAMYRQLKLEIILDSPLNDHRLKPEGLKAQGSGLKVRLQTPAGHGHGPVQHLTCLAVQNLWFAARARVSMLYEGAPANLLELPANVFPVAYLCLGYVTEFLPEPELQTKGWRQRLPLTDLLHANGWATPLKLGEDTEPRIRCGP